MNLCNPRVIRELMEEAGIRFRRDLGQNFLVDPNVPEEIADAAADDPSAVILEIGPGIGCLTAALAERYRRVVSVEIDRGLIPVLGKTLSDYRNVTVVNADCMTADLAALLSEAAGGGVPGVDFPVAVAANLPYYITTPILLRLLESGIRFSRITVMVQKEVADRLAAAPGSRDYGAITAVLGYYGTATRRFTVSPGSFLPPPAVSSAVVSIDLYREPAFKPLSEKTFFDTVHAAFEQRRKTLVNALSARFSDLGKEWIAGIVVSCGHPADIRGERLSTGAFVALSDALFRARNRIGTETD
ncbi:MAG: 16S rRNA (adenine(1518)-N(6)/adenine(1519)-N(6))-dimethyltransferase RsmA [Clostridia bacterium]|nr:16S rRNA (adenine(1518)-N(6)/adenine(1519)-N(6))-dimethyltransferase RsmA [Clostridia bacterium]